MYTDLHREWNWPYSQSNPASHHRFSPSPQFPRVLRRLPGLGHHPSKVSTRLDCAEYATNREDQQARAYVGLLHLERLEHKSRPRDLLSRGRILVHCKLVRSTRSTIYEPA